MHFSEPEINNYLQTITDLYKDHLYNNILPFWTQNCVDKESGGFIFSLDRDGTKLSNEKAMWIHARFVWLLSTLYSTVEKKKEWIELADHGIKFINKYGFDHDGRMFFATTREGEPLRKRRYLFTESFTCMAFAAYSKASGKLEYAEKANNLFKLILGHIKNPDRESQKFLIPMKSQSVPMINIVMWQILRENIDDQLINKTIIESIDEIENDFMNNEFNAILETVGPNGEFMDSFDGRLLNPGHSIETAWFIMREGIYRNDERIKNLGLKIFNWSWKWGWDKEYGGIIYFRDVKNLPVSEYWHDMKFWWPQCEAIIASLFAYKITRDTKYLEKHKLINEYTFNLFPDKEFGEWFGYFHRDGRLSNSIKGNLWKGPFHIPRMLLTSYKLIE